MRSAFMDHHCRIYLGICGHVLRADGRPLNQRGRNAGLEIGPHQRRSGRDRIRYGDSEAAPRFMQCQDWFRGYILPGMRRPWQSIQDS